MNFPTGCYGLGVEDEVEGVGAAAGGDEEMLSPELPFFSSLSAFFRDFEG
jgi:hypothetical protein